MGIPIAQSFDATASGATIKKVQCENCSCNYVYFMKREAIGSGTSVLFLDNAGAQDRAQQNAQQQLEQLLILECDPIPCPQCGSYQSNMCQKLRKEHLAWLKTTSLLALLLAMISVPLISINEFGKRGPDIFFRCILLTIFSVGMISAAILPLLRYILARSYDPNSQPLDERLKIASEKAVLREDYDRMEAEAIAKEEAKAQARQKEIEAEEASRAQAIQEGTLSPALQIKPMTERAARAKTPKKTEFNWGILYAIGLVVLVGLRIMAVMPKLENRQQHPAPAVLNEQDAKLIQQLFLGEVKQRIKQGEATAEELKQFNIDPEEYEAYKEQLRKQRLAKPNPENPNLDMD